MRGKIIAAWDLPATLDRAREWIGSQFIHYHLAHPNGGTDPYRNPHDPETGGCDCIGFAVNCAGFDRYQPGKFPLYTGYINTDSMVKEATSPVVTWDYGAKKGTKRVGRQWFTVLEKPEPGCFIVAASYRRKLPYPKRVIGHIGVVDDCSEWAAQGLAGITVIHCSSSNAKRPGNIWRSAVWKTSGTVWKNYPRVYFIKFNREYALQVKAA